MSLTKINPPVEGPIYIAGPISGVPLYNAPAFNKVKAFLSVQFPGVEVLSPLDNHEGLDPAGHTYGYFFRKGLEQMLQCKTVMFLEGWQGSMGAKAEFIVAERCEMARFLLMETEQDKFMWAGTDASLLP